MRVFTAELSLAKSAAIRARNEVLSSMEASQLVCVEGREIKIGADAIAEEAIVDTLAQSGIPILSEESGFNAHEAVDLYWVIDPLDGSANFSRGLAPSCVSVALIHEDSPVLGVVLDVGTGDCFEGDVTGARQNGQPIHCAPECTVARAMIATGIPARVRLDQGYLARLCDTVASVQKVRMIGSAATSLVLLAQGKVDAYLENGIMIWDVAGGLAIAKAAGAILSLRRTETQHMLDVVAASGPSLLRDLL